MIKYEIKALIKVLQDQLVNFEKVPDDRLEAFLELCSDEVVNYTDERIETRDLKIVLLCTEADVRDAGNIGHSGNTTDYYWDYGEWVDGQNLKVDEEEDETDTPK